jgi:arginase family enzyme
MAKKSKGWLAMWCALTASLLLGCSSLKTPATADVAVSKAAVDNAADADGTQFAPAEMASARSNLNLANQAMAAKNYKLATELANKASADAKLAQGKANSAKAQAAADALQDSIRVLNQELLRNL